MTADLEERARHLIYLVDGDTAYCDEVEQVFASHNQQRQPALQGVLELEVFDGLDAAMQRI